MNYFLIFLVVVGICGGGYYEYSALQMESIDNQRKIVEQRGRIDQLEAQNKQFNDDKTLITRAKWDDAQAKIADLTKQVQTSQTALAAEKKAEADAAAAAAAAATAAAASNAPPPTPAIAPPPPPGNKLGTIKMTDGKTYQDCQLLKVKANGIVVNQAGGVTEIMFSDLPPELQKRFGYDPKQPAPLTDDQVQYFEDERLTAARLGI